MRQSSLQAARTAVQTTHTAFLAALRAYVAAVVRHEDRAVQRDLATRGRVAADTYAAALQELLELLASTPPHPRARAEQQQLHRLQRELAQSRRLLTDRSS